MKFLTIVCCALITIALVQAEDTCTSSDGNVVKVGETFTKSGECAIYTCESAGSYTAKTCAESAVVNPDAYDFHPQDDSKPWPECCAKYVKKE